MMYFKVIVVLSLYSFNWTKDFCNYFIRISILFRSGNYSFGRSYNLADGEKITAIFITSSLFLHRRFSFSLSISCLTITSFYESASG